MPGRDGTGPAGVGSMTGRGMGRCSGVNAPYNGYAAGYGAGFGAGRGFRRMLYRTGTPGYGRGFYSAPIAAADYKENLKVRKNILQQELENINSLINDSAKDSNSNE